MQLTNSGTEFCQNSTCLLSGRCAEEKLGSLHWGGPWHNAGAADGGYLLRYLGRCGWLGRVAGGCFYCGVVLDGVLVCFGHLLVC